MNRVLTPTFVALIVITMVASALAQPDQEPPAFTWQTASPESQGMSKAKLDALKDSLAARKSTGFLVARNDKIVYEWYAERWSGTRPHGTASLAKALLDGLSLAFAMTDGLISIEDPAAKFIPQWRDDSQKSKIKIRHLGSHTSGMEDSSVPGIVHPNEPGWKGEFWKRQQPPVDPFTISRDQTPLLFEPGKDIQYSNPGIAMLTYAVTAALKVSPHRDVRTLLRERVMRPIGAPDKEWSCGYGQTFDVDGLPLVGSWGGGNYSSQTAARIGRLMLREGDWDGRRIISRDAVRLTTGSAGHPGGCGMGWWTNALCRYAGVPRDAYWGAGAGDQLLFVVPSLNLIMVRNGETIAPLPGEPPILQDDVFTKYHDLRAHVLFEPLVAAVQQDAAAPQNNPDNSQNQKQSTAPA